MKAERLKEIRGYIERTKPAAANIAIDYLRELIAELEARGGMETDTAEADPGELFRRGHVMLQATAEFQLYSAVALLQSYARTFTHTPNAAAVFMRVLAELHRTASLGELTALKHEAEWSPRERQLMTTRKRLKRILELAQAAAAYATLSEEIGAET